VLEPHGTRSAKPTKDIGTYPDSENYFEHFRHDHGVQGMNLLPSESPEGRWAIHLYDMSDKPAPKGASEAGKMGQNADTIGKKASGSDGETGKVDEDNARRARDSDSESESEEADEDKDKQAPDSDDPESEGYTVDQGFFLKTIHNFDLPPVTSNFYLSHCGKFVFYLNLLPVFPGRDRAAGGVRIAGTSRMRVTFIDSETLQLVRFLDFDCHELAKQISEAQVFGQGRYLALKTHNKS
jgi:hypothetical protein